MAGAFDPYRKWLGIPEDSRPPTHYQLLGIAPTEKDRDVIELAVIRQSAFVRNYQKGPNSEAATQLLTEIAAAKACLLDPEKRAKYDAGLKPVQAAPAPIVATTAPAPQPARPAQRQPARPVRPATPQGDLERLASAISAADPLAARPGAPKQRAVGSGLPQPVLIAGSVAAGAVLILLLVILFSGKSASDNPIANADPNQLSSNDANGRAPSAATEATKPASSDRRINETAKASAPPNSLPDQPNKLATQRWTSDSATPEPANAPFDVDQASTYQQNWAKHLNTSVESTNSVGMRLILLPPGEFKMGSTRKQVEESLKLVEELKAGLWKQRQIRDFERPQRRVTLPTPLLIGATEVTVGQFHQFADASDYDTLAEKFGGDSNGVDPAQPGNKNINWRSPGFAVDDSFPVTQIAWSDACAMCNWLSAQEKLPPAYQKGGKDGWTPIPDSVGYRLPTEAEWEYACRAGTTTQYSFGDDSRQLENFAWIESNSGGAAHAVGLKRPNPFGLYDVHGNVEEWCQDYFGAYPEADESDPQGPMSGEKRVLRSSHFKDDTRLPSRSAFRNDWNPTTQRYNLMGFRVARSWPADLKLLASLTPVRGPTTASMAAEAPGDGAATKLLSLEDAGNIVEAASAAHQRNVKEAERTLRDSLARAGERLLLAFNDEIASQRKIGAEGVEFAGLLEDEKNQLERLLRIDADRGLAALADERDQITKRIVDKIWYFHWEGRDRDFFGAWKANGQIDGKGFDGWRWRLEPRWVLVAESPAIKQFVMLDPKTLRGFDVSTGLTVSYLEEKPLPQPGKTRDYEKVDAAVSQFDADSIAAAKRCFEKCQASFEQLASAYEKLDASLRVEKTTNSPLQQRRDEILQPVRSYARDAKVSYSAFLKERRSLFDKIWRRQDEKEGQHHPFRWYPDGHATDFKTWKLEAKWMAIANGNQMFLTDVHTMHGYFPPNGRQVGAFADKGPEAPPEQPKPSVVAEGQEITITKAVFGVPGKDDDVTDLMQKFVAGKSFVGIQTDGRVMGDPTPNKRKRLVVTCRVGQKPPQKLDIMEGDVAPLPKMPSGGLPLKDAKDEFTIIAATAGAGLTWKDVTSRAIERIPAPDASYTWNKICGGIGDPWPNFHKHLIIWFDYHGSRYVRIIEDDKEKHTLLPES